MQCHLFSGWAPEMESKFNIKVSRRECGWLIRTEKHSKEKEEEKGQESAKR